MAEQFQLLTSTAKKLYKKTSFVGGIERLLFPIKDRSIKTTVSIDSLTGNVFAARALRSTGDMSHVREYAPGVGNIFEVPLSKEKVRIGQELSDSVTVGLEADAPQARHLQEKVNNIINGPMGMVAAFNMAVTKAAIDVYRTGKFQALDSGVVTTEIDFGRESGNDIEYDLTGTGATFDAGIKALYDALNLQDIPQDGLTVILGSEWYTAFSEATAVQEKRKATNNMALIEEKMIPDVLQGIPGLYVVGVYKVNGIPTPVRFLHYAPSQRYLAVSGGTTAPFIPADEALMFDLNGQAYDCTRGIDVVQNGMVVRQEGDIVFDEFISNDPVATWIRGSGRRLFVRGEINFTGRVTNATP